MSSHFDPRWGSGTVDPVGHFIGWLLLAAYAVFMIGYGLWSIMEGGVTLGCVLIALALLVAASAIMFRTRYRTDVQHDRFAKNRCPACGYERRGLPEPRCPECGTTWNETP